MKDAHREGRGSDLPVYRKKPLPWGELRGRFLISEPIIGATAEALTSFALAGIREGGHEGIVFWAGREVGDTTLLVQALIPAADHSWGSVMVTREEVGRMQQAARRHGLGLLSQVHSHPGGDARHSDGDDDLILLPFENMLSIVVPGFGIDFTEISQVCVHQYQDGRWVLCSAESVRNGICTFPPVLDLRGEA